MAKPLIYLLFLSLLRYFGYLISYRRLDILVLHEKVSAAVDSGLIYNIKSHLSASYNALRVISAFIVMYLIVMNVFAPGIEQSYPLLGTWL
jgi:hypothetical protein